MSRLERLLDIATRRYLERGDPVPLDLLVAIEEEGGWIPE
jgi:hypothetical protein